MYENPKYGFGDLVRLKSHPDMIARVICEIWDDDEQKRYYEIEAVWNEKLPTREVPEESIEGV